MKKFLFLLISLFILSACVPETEIKVHNDPSTALFHNIEHFEYNGHKYIWFRYYTMHDGEGGGVVHDPDCECLTIDYD